MQVVHIAQKIPALPNSKYDAISQDARYEGRVRYNIILVEAPGLEFQDGDSLEGAWITATDIVENLGTATHTVEDGKITFSAGTVFGLQVNGVWVPCIEEGKGSVFSILGDELTINSANADPWIKQDEFFFEALYGYYLDSATGEHFAYQAPGTQYVPGGWWNHSNNKYRMQKAKNLILQDLLEGPFWFDTNRDPVAKTQEEIDQQFKQTKATFFCPDPGKGLALYDEILTGTEYATVDQYFRGDCNA